MLAPHLLNEHASHLRGGTLWLVDWRSYVNECYNSMIPIRLSCLELPSRLRDRITLYLARYFVVFDYHSIAAIISDTKTYLELKDAHPLMDQRESKDNKCR